MKSEHNGAKNGGGYWGKRAEAKKKSKKQRRKEAQTIMEIYESTNIDILKNSPES